MRRGKLYAVAYDISHDGRRVKTANVLKSYGERVQYSVFECWLNPDELKDLKRRLQKVHKVEEDSIRIYHTPTSVEVLGLGEVSEESSILLI